MSGWLQAFRPAAPEVYSTPAAVEATIRLVAFDLTLNGTVHRVGADPQTPLL